MVFYIRFFINSMALYILLYIGLLVLSPSMQRHGLFLKSSNWSHALREKSKFIVSHMENKALATNFMMNVRMLSQEENRIFQNSGLVHLLAISGAQIVPIAGVFGYMVCWCLYFCWYRSCQSLRLMVRISTITLYLQTLLAFFLSFLFGCSGALLRVSGLEYVKRLKIFKMFFAESSFFYVLEDTLLSIFLILILSILFGNAYSNYSFLLSAVGSCCAILASALANGKFLNKHVFVGFFHFFKFVFCAVLTSFFVSIILLPFSQISILNSCLANILAIPLITYFVTPAVLLVLALPQQMPYFEFFIDALEWGLNIFKDIAIIFSQYENKTVLFDTKLLFSAQGLLYVDGVLIMLMSFLDVFRNRKILKIRRFCCQTRTQQG